MNAPPEPRTIKPPEVRRRAPSILGNKHVLTCDRVGPSVPATTVAFNLDHASIHVWRGSLDHGRNVYRRLASLLSADERDRANRFRFYRDHARYVVGRGLLRSLLAQYVDIPAAELRFCYSQHLKPALVGHAPYFNVSHSGATVLFAFSSSTAVGIDVELVTAGCDGEKIPERFFSPLEVETLRALPEADQPHAFLACWTRKEAFLKARGDGLTLALDSFDVAFAPGVPAAILRTAWCPEEHSDWQLLDVSNYDEGYVAALAAPATGWHCIDAEVDISTVVYN